MVLVDQPQSRYPYSADGRIAVPAEADWLDPLLGLSFIAAVTTRIGLATGVLLLPEHNPVVAAKQAATLDVLSGGRLTLGIGIGWMPQEFELTGADMARRGARAAEYVQVLRALWGGGPTEFSGEFYQVPSGDQSPKPVQPGGPPVLLGGMAKPALQRIGRIADGWITSSRTDLSRISELIAVVQDAAVAAGRDPAALRYICRHFDVIQRRGGGQRRVRRRSSRGGWY